TRARGKREPAERGGQRAGGLGGLAFFSRTGSHQHQRTAGGCGGAERSIVGERQRDQGASGKLLNLGGGLLRGWLAELGVPCVLEAPEAERAVGAGGGDDASIPCGGERSH